MNVRFIDLFCGIGGFHVVGDRLGWDCVFSSDIDAEARVAYKANFGREPAGDIFKVTNDQIPEHDVLFAGFPCQPFSIIGDRKGFLDEVRGTLFFEIARILEHRQPRAFVLENVKQLVGHDGGRTLSRILSTLRSLGYVTDFRVLNALNFGLPQKRERVLIVGFRGNGKFEWPKGGAPMTPLSKILEPHVDPKYFASKKIVGLRNAKHKAQLKPAIWHENKSGNISSYPYSCALRAGASYNYLLVDGIRRLTPREMLRLQGFPDSFKIVCNDSQTRKQAGNSVPVPLIQAVVSNLVPILEANPTAKRTMRKELQVA